jgi:hypothetical protein
VGRHVLVVTREDQQRVGLRKLVAARALELGVGDDVDVLLVLDEPAAATRPRSA